MEKRYIAYVEGDVNDDTVKKFRDGIELKDFTTKSAELIIKEKKDGLTVAEVALREGKFHQIKRMFEAEGCKVVHLKRISFGKIKLDEGLDEGEYRLLDDNEREYVKAVSRGGAV